jgi:transposase
MMRDYPLRVLEGLFEVILVNARHSKAVPGRKTDVRDCEWLADRLRHGLLKASFMPPREIRELRELRRYRPTLTTEHPAVAHRRQKLWESANLKLGPGASDGRGVRGRLRLRALAQGERDAGKRAALAPGRLRSKTEELRRALTGRRTPVQGWVLAEWLTRWEEIEAAVSRVEARSREAMESGPDPFVKAAVAVRESRPGIGEHGAQTLSAEIGVDLERCGSAEH